MKKKKHHSQPKKDDKPVTLGDMLNQDLVEQLKGKKQELKAAEDKQKEEEECRKREERRLREKIKVLKNCLERAILTGKNTNNIKRRGRLFRQPLSCLKLWTFDHLCCAYLFSFAIDLMIANSSSLRGMALAASALAFTCSARLAPAVIEATAGSARLY